MSIIFIRTNQSTNIGKRSYIPIEWVIDIADESNGWFYGTAYHFDDTTQMLHVMVPDKENPSFDGQVYLDYRTVHLVECVDGNSEALFNKMVRISVVKVRWELEWFEELNPTLKDQNFQESEIVENYAGVKGRYVLSTARYFVRMANQLLVEDEGFGQDSKGFVMLTADLNVRLRWCHKGRGAEDFLRLITDNLCQCTPDASTSADIPAVTQKDRDGGLASSTSSAPVSLKKIATMSKALRENFVDIMDERDHLHEDRKRLAKIFKSFALDGDLDAGLKLWEFTEDVETKEKSKDQNKDRMDRTVEEAWTLCQKVEKGMSKAATKDDIIDDHAEVEHYRRQQDNLKRQLEEKENQIRNLKKDVAARK